MQAVGASPGVFLRQAGNKPAMDRNRWIVTTLWFVLVAVGGMAGTFLMSEANGAGWAVAGVLSVLAFGGLIFVKVYRWAQKDRERWRARSHRKHR